MPLLHYAVDAVHVFQNNPYLSDPSSAVVYVGIAGRGSSSGMPQPMSGQCIGLLQFPPLSLPENQMISSIRLCMPVYSVSSHAMQIGVFQNMVPFEASTVHYLTRPAVASFPLSVFQVGPDSQSSYVSCDLKVLFKDLSGYLPGIGLTLKSIGRQVGMVAFCARVGSYTPYLEIALCPREGKKQSCDPDKGFVENVFRECVFKLSGQEREIITPVLYTAGAKTITFFVRNEGEHPLEFRLQLSPDGRDFLNDQQNFSLAAGEMKAAAPYLFGKFMRVCLNPAQSGQGIAARVWCQAQTNNYMVKGDLKVSASLPENSALAMPISGAASH
jgi:hypothetical protein